MIQSRKLLPQNFEAPEYFPWRRSLCDGEKNDHIMDADHIRPSPKCSWRIAIIFSLHFLQEHYQDTHGDCILCCTCNLSDNVNAVAPTLPSSHMSCFHLLYDVPCGWGCGPDLKVDSMLCSHLLNQPHCCEKPWATEMDLTYQVYSCPLFLMIQVPLFIMEILETESVRPKHHLHSSYFFLQ